MPPPLITWDQFKELPDALRELFPAAWNSIEARLLIGAIDMQETKFTTRRQIIRWASDGKPVFGPAVSFGQFEQGGGIKGVMTHPASSYYAKELCRLRGIGIGARDVWVAMQTDDVLGYGFARLLLRTDPKPLPRIGDVAAAYACYNELWRPGVKRPNDWPDSYAAAVKGVR